MEKQTNTIVLFDVDGTLTVPRNKVQQDMIDTFKQLQQKVCVGIVGGSDQKKIYEQLGQEFAESADYTFSENGLYALKDGKFLDKTSILDKLGNDNIKRFVNFCLAYLAQLDIPVKRGTFIEFRNGLINVSPIGRNCSQSERDEFEIYDKEHKIRETFINVLTNEFQDLNLNYSIGGQISFDVFPKGWDKTFCLQYLTQFENVYFFGDKTFKGGNDYEIFESERTKGYTTTGPQETIKMLNELFLN